MGMVRALSLVALRQVARGASQAAGLAGAEAVARLLGKHFTDHSQRLVGALRGANERAWQALEVALAGESLWGKLDDADDRAFRQQVRAFLDASPLRGLPAHGAEFRQQALRELRAARKSGLLLTGALQPDDLASGAADLTRFEGDTALEPEWRALEELAVPLREAGYSALAHLVSLRPTNDEEKMPLLVLAVRYFFRRAVEQDEELFRSLSWARWESLSGAQQQGFDQLADALAEHGRRLEEVLDVLTEVRAAVLDLRREIAGQREQIQRLADDVLGVLTQHQLAQRELRPGDSLSLRTDDERRLVRDLVTRYRGLPEEQRRQLPALLNAVGKMEVVVGNFESARRDFQEVAGLAASHADRAEAHFNAYQAALECRQWPEALAALREALALDPDRFTPFPVGKYEPERILGAGGFGVAFLCRDRHSGSRVVIKALRGDGLDRPVSEVFAEARVLEEVEHPAIIRLRYCDYAGPSGGRPYLVMDYFDAPTLADYVAEHGPLAPADATALMRTVAEALQAAHGKNIFHRDVKPANLLVRREPGGSPSQWQIKLIDFGLALKTNVMQATMAATYAGAHTLVGSSVAGTLDYAAPEQLGKLPGVAVGAHSDVYGLGKTCCYALFGTTLPLPKHWRNLSQELADLLGQCLAEDPKERPAGCGELLQRLQAPVARVARAVEVPVAKAAPVATVASPAAGPAPMPVGMRALIGGVLGLLGAYAIWRILWILATTPGTVAWLPILVAGAAPCAVGAALGRSWGARPPEGGRRPVGAALALLIGLAMVGSVLLWFCIPRQALGLTILLPALVGTGLGIVWGWRLENTVGAVALWVVSLAGMVMNFPYDKSAWLFALFLTLVGAGVAALTVAKPMQDLDRPVDRFIGSVLEHTDAAFRRFREKVAAPPAPLSSSDTADPTSLWATIKLAVLLLLPVLAGGMVGMAAGLNSGARTMGLPPGMEDLTSTWLAVAGAVAGGLGGLRLRPRFSLTGLFCLATGGLLGAGSAYLLGKIGWWTIEAPLGLALALVVWGGLLGALWGLPSQRPLAGALGGALLLGVVAIAGQTLAHPDPAALFGAAVGVLAGTLVWRRLKRGRLWLVRCGAAGLVVALGCVLFGFRTGLASPARAQLFVAPNVTQPFYYSGRPIAPAFSREGDRLLTLDAGGVRLWDVASAKQLHTFPIRSGKPVGLTFGLDGSPQYLSAEGVGLKKWNVETGELLATYNSSPPQRFVSLAVLSPDGGMALWTYDRSLWTADLQKGVVTAYPVGGVPQITALALAPSGRQVLLGCQDGSVELWELPGAGQGIRAARKLRTSRKQAAPVQSLAFSRDGRRAFALARQYSPSSLMAWDVEGWREFHELRSGTPGESPTCTAFSPDGERLLSGTSKGAIHLWDVVSGKQLRSYRQHRSLLLPLDGTVQQIAFSPDGDSALSWTTNGRALRLWKLDD